jgi:hypothetical protein
MISGSQGGEYEDGFLLGCSAVWIDMSLNIILVKLYQSTRRYDPEHSRLHTAYCMLVI